ncbi:hypothetical protein Va1_239 [Vibrio phage Va1]|nr:hypothetical protein Va1_239 [Vibrio phage Va1]
MKKDDNKNNNVPIKEKRIIMIHGIYRSGKDYAAEQIETYLHEMGYTTEKMSFADPMKFILTKTLNVDLETFDNHKNNKSELFVQGDDLQNVFLTDFRTLIQNFGTEAMKPIFGEHVWATLLYKKAIASEADFVIVPDFRFLTEQIKGASTIKVINKDVEHGDGHRSENELKDFKFDYKIDNTGKPDISKDVKRIINSIIKKTT